MKSFFSFTVALALSVIAFVGCNKENIINGLDEPAVSGPKVCKMTFNGSVSGYDNSVLRGVDTKGSFAWNDGDKVYIMFYDGDKALPGEATYSSAEGWSVYYEDDIPTGTGLRCDVRFYVNEDFANLSLIKTTPFTAIYEDGRSIWEDEELRFRNAGVDHVNLEVPGLPCGIRFAHDGISAFTANARATARKRHTSGGKCACRKIPTRRLHVCRSCYRTTIVAPRLRR